jgi:hypothetical protein
MLKRSTAIALAIVLCLACGASDLLKARSYLSARVPPLLSALQAAGQLSQLEAQAQLANFNAISTALDGVIQLQHDLRSDDPDRAHKLGVAAQHVLDIVEQLQSQNAFHVKSVEATNKLNKIVGLARIILVATLPLEGHIGQGQVDVKARLQELDRELQP